MPLLRKEIQKAYRERGGEALLATDKNRKAISWQEMPEEEKKIKQQKNRDRMRKSRANKKKLQATNEVEAVPFLPYQSKSTETRATNRYILN
jgi:hypothetical protein